jgi:hypothetical protein
VLIIKNVLLFEFILLVGAYLTSCNGVVAVGSVKFLQFVENDV